MKARPIPENFADLWNASRTVREASEATGLCASRAHKIARLMGLPRKCSPRGTKVDAVASSKAKELRAKGLTFDQIAAEIGRSKTFAHEHGSKP